MVIGVFFLAVFVFGHVVQEIKIQLHKSKNATRLVYFCETVASLKTGLPNLQEISTLVSYDSNYYYEYIAHDFDIGDWCHKIGQEVNSKFGMKFTMVSSVYRFHCKHKSASVGFVFVGPPVDHVLAILPTSSGTNVVVWGDKRHVFQSSLCLTPPQTSSVVTLCGRSFVVAVVQPFLAWDM